ncbi:MAG: phosphoribosyltransferase family protein [Acidobacteriota bacterium]
MESYDDGNRTGVRNLSWEEFARLSRDLAETVRAFEPDVIVGVAKAGLLPATAVACALRCELIPVRISRRVDDVVVHRTPQWRVPLTAGLAGKRVAVIDEMADTGETLRLVAEHTRENGAPKILTSVLVQHSWADPKPDFAALHTDELVVFPWDAKVLVDSQWQIHPEIAAAVESLERESTAATTELRPSELRLEDD